MDIPLFSAIQSDDLVSIQRLISDEGVDPNEFHIIEDFLDRRYTALDYAVAESSEYHPDREETLQLLLSLGADSASGAPLLECRSKEYAELLIDNGADVDGASPQFEDGTPTGLVMSARRFDIEMLRFFLANYAEPDQINQKGETLPIQMIGRFFSHEHGGPDKEEPTAAVLKELFAAGSSVEAKTQWGEEVIVVFFKGAAAQNFEAPAIRDAIIDAGADVSAKGAFERPLTAICMWAPVFRMQPYRSLSKLFSNGAEYSLNEYDLNGYTTLFHFLDGARKNFYRLKDGEDDLLNLLLVRGSNIDHVSNIGETPLLFIVRRACPRKDTIYQYPVPTKGMSGREIYLKVIEVLLEEGSDPQYDDLDGNNSIDIARTGDNCDDVYRLVNKSKYKRQTFVPATSKDDRSDPQAAQLRPSAKALYDTANTAYQAIEGATQPYIKINEGKRSAFQQARYFENYIRYIHFGGPQANLAARPGQSRHEYGLAMDIYRLLDEERYHQALSENGWERTVSSEPWHYAATSASDWSDVQKSKADIAPTSIQYEQQLMTFIRLEQSERDQRNALNEKRNRTKEAEREVSKDKREVREAEREKVRIERSIAAEERNLDDLRRQRAAAEQRYKTMSYSDCPNGFPYNECSHTEEKNAYIERRRRLGELIQRLRREERQAQGEITRLKREVQRASRDLAKRRRELKDSEDEAKASRTDERRAAQELRRITNDKNRANREKQRILREIAAVTG
ncbi:MAG: hypothetical protein AAGJ84_12480 [Pseudomonadota bacterium]